VRTEKMYVRRRYRLAPWRAEVSENAFLNIKLRPIYDTRCYFNVRSKADISQLNLPHGICGVIILAMHIGLQILILMPYLMNASRKFVTHNLSHTRKL